jgi:hypothetical protein
VIRGFGLGCSMMPATAAAYATVTKAAVPEATTVINVFQRVGGSVGTALVAVVLEHQFRTNVPHVHGVAGGSVQLLPPAIRERVAIPLSHAFDHTFWWIATLTAVAIVPAIILALHAPRASVASPELIAAAPAGDG